MGGLKNRGSRRYALISPARYQQTIGSLNDSSRSTSMSGESLNRPPGLYDGALNDANSSIVYARLHHDYKIM